MGNPKRWSENVLPHGPLEEVVPGFWQVEGTLPRGPLPRTMAIARLPNGSLLIHSPIVIERKMLKSVLRKGKVSVVVVPSGMHRLDAATYREHFPDAQLVCPRAAQEAVEQVVPVDSSAEDFLPKVGVTCHKPKGIKPDELVYEVPLEGGGVALLFCDALFNLPRLPGIGGMMLGLMGSTGFFGTTRIGRWFLSDRQGWKQWLDDTAQRDDIAVLSVAHGDPITEDCSARLREAAGRL